MIASSTLMPALFGDACGFEHPLVVLGHHLAEPRRPRRASPRGSRAATVRAGLGVMLCGWRRGGTRRRPRRGRRGRPSRGSSRVKNMPSGSWTYAMPPDIPAPKFRPGRAEHDHATAGHVLAPVVADALDDRGRARVAHAEPLADQAPEVHLAAGRAVEDHVAGDDVVLRDERGVVGRSNDDPTAREALADVVVRVADEPQRDPRRARTRRSSGPPNP